jgi:hypothetical protein
MSLRDSFTRPHFSRYLMQELSSSAGGMAVLNTLMSLMIELRMAVETHKKASDAQEGSVSAEQSEFNSKLGGPLGFWRASS